MNVVDECGQDMEESRNPVENVSQPRTFYSQTAVDKFFPSPSAFSAFSYIFTSPTTTTKYFKRYRLEKLSK